MNKQVILINSQLNASMITLIDNYIVVVYGFPGVLEWMFQGSLYSM